MLHITYCRGYVVSLNLLGRQALATGHQALDTMQDVSLYVGAAQILYMPDVPDLAIKLSISNATKTSNNVR